MCGAVWKVQAMFALPDAIDGRHVWLYKLCITILTVKEALIRRKATLAINIFIIVVMLSLGMILYTQLGDNVYLYILYI